MRWIVLSLLLVVSVATATELTAYQQWLSFTQGAAFNAAGPAGMYAAQDTKELQPGSAAYLHPAKELSALKWSPQPASDAVVRVEYRNSRAILSGPGIASIDLLKSPDRQLTLPNKLTVRATLREATLKVWLYNPELVAQRKFRGLDYFPYDPKAVVNATFSRQEQPVPVNYLDSRDHAGVMYVVGTAKLPIGGKIHAIRAYSYKKRWADIDTLLFLLKDRTSGKSTYGGGRVIEVHIPRGAPPAAVTINLNMAYSFLCAYSEFYNCPIALTDRLDAALPYGEKYPPL
jgi:hypothetical protein